GITGTPTQLLPKENILVARFPAVPLIGMVLIRRTAGAFGSGACAHAAFRRHSTAAHSSAVQSIARKELLASVHKRSGLATIRPSHMLVFDPGYSAPASRR